VTFGTPPTESDQQRAGQQSPARPLERGCTEHQTDDKQVCNKGHYCQNKISSDERLQQFGALDRSADGPTPDQRIERDQESLKCDRDERDEEHLQVSRWFCRGISPHVAGWRLQIKKGSLFVP
jgi:hypothetical protein